MPLIIPLPLATALSDQYAISQWAWSGLVWPQCRSRSSHVPISGTNDAVTPPLHGAHMPGTVLVCMIASIIYFLGVFTALRSLHRPHPSICTLNPCSPSPNSIPSHPERKNVNTSISFMSSTGQATSSTSNLQFIVDAALADYTKITGTDLSKTPFVTAIQQSNSPEAILQLLHQREKSFKEYREGNRKLINCLIPMVNVFQALSGILGEAVNQVSRACHPVTLLTVISSDLTPTGNHFVCCH
jgi:fungal STAND N-terminal Goodbye domain